MALQRLNCLEKRMTGDPSLQQFLNEQMRSYEKKGYIRKLAKHEVSHGGQSWLVWDAAAAVDGVALNTYLLKGPDLLASLVGVLIRFRERPYAITGDIREMFHQIRVRKEDQCAQQFLWRYGDRSKDPDTYVMAVMTFGAACSPSLANFIKNSNASRFVNDKPEAVEAIQRNTYVDDWLQSVDTEQKMIALALQVKYIHKEGGFEMRNWLSNSSSVLQAIAGTAEQTGRPLQDSSTTYEKVLGTWWLPQTDELTFLAKLENSGLNDNICPTKRSVLRVIMSVYDPLGLIGFFMIQAKIILQNIWRSGVAWVAPLREEERKAWSSWVQSLPRIQDVRILRCYPLASRSHDVQLHIFCDASKVAYAAAAYLRATVGGMVQCCLVASKSRVAPLKPVSIPRLELMGAILGPRLAKFVRSELTFPISKEMYWIDSKNVLYWIRSDTRKFSQFVGVRIGEILESSNVMNWRWVPSADNVADDATKLKQWATLNGELGWFKGPRYLALPTSEWPETILQNLTESESVHHIELSTASSTSPFTEVVPDVTRFSKWEKLRGATRCVLRFLSLTNKRPVKSEFVQRVLHDATCHSAESLIILMCQGEDFAEEILSLQRGEIVSRKSPIFKCSPYIDEDGVLRVKGRIDLIKGIPVNLKRPVILPPRHPVTLLMIDYFHRKYHHHHNEIVVNEVRQQYWVSGLRSLVSRIVHKCGVCRIRWATPQPPEMGSLPREHLALNTRPFTYTGVDFFGPIDVIVGRRHEKRWGVLFTCLTVRAVHIELSHSLSTDAFLLVLKQFISRRGVPRRIISDNGTNFRGASRILQTEMERISSDELQQRHPDIEWRFIPPAAPHMGGAWERMIRSAKSILSDILCTATVHEHTLRAALADIENILNSRPLTYIPLDTPNDEAHRRRQRPGATKELQSSIATGRSVLEKVGEGIPAPT